MSCTRSDVVDVMDYTLSNAKMLWAKLGVEAGVEQIHACAVSMFIEICRRGLIGEAFADKPQQEALPEAVPAPVVAAVPAPQPVEQSTGTEQPKPAEKAPEAEKQKLNMRKGTQTQVKEKKQQEAIKAGLPVDGPLPEINPSDDQAVMKQFATVLRKDKGWAYTPEQLITLWCALRVSISQEDCVSVASGTTDPKDLLELAFKTPIESLGVEDIDYDPFEDDDAVMGKIRGFLAGTWKPEQLQAVA